MIISLDEEIDRRRSLAVRVDGQPRPQGSKRLIRGHLVEAANGLHDWRLKVSRACLAAATASGWVVVPRGTPVSVTARFSIEPGKERARFLRNVAEAPHAIAPDVDKLVRGLLDGITASNAVWVDDSQVANLHVSAYWAGTIHDPEPGVSLAVSVMGAIR